MSQLKIAVIPGDGIGWEVVPEGLKVLEAIGGRHGLDFQFTEFDWAASVFTKLAVSCRMTVWRNYANSTPFS